MTTRTHPHPANPSGTLIKYRIDIKQSGKWKPLRIRGAMPLFDDPYKANNFGIQFNQFHKSLMPNHPTKKL